MNRIILDTTFILPLFGLQISKPVITNQNLTSIFGLTKSKYQFFLPDTCLLETAYLLNRQYQKNRKLDGLERYSIILPTITKAPNVTIVSPLLVPEIMEIANKIRNAGHTDYLDCMIAATAIHLDGDFLTIDQPLKKLIVNSPDLKYNKFLDWKAFQNH